MQQQIAGDRTRVLLLAVHAQGERLNTTTHRIAFVRRKHATQMILREVDTFAQPVVLDHHKTGVDFGMAGQILGSGMDDVSAPWSSGSCRYGVTNVLSTMEIAP